MENTKILFKLLASRVLPHFENYWRRQFGDKDMNLTDSELLEIVVKEVGLKFISRRDIMV
jgi:hypothetical protein